LKKQKITTIGGATFDMFIKAHDHSIMQLKDQSSFKDWICLDYGGKVKIDEVHETFGGGAANTSVAFARMGFDACFLGKVGTDYGDKVIDNLKNEGVDVSFAKKTNRDKTALSTILNTFEGDRTVLAYPGANMFFNAKDLPLDDLGRADWIFLNHLTKSNSKIPHEILKILKKNPNIKLAWNPGHEQLAAGLKKWKALLAHTEILFLNKEEASLFTRIPYKLAGIKQHFQTQQQTAVQAQEQQLRGELQQFMDAKDDKGRPKHPYFNEVRTLMGSFYGSGQNIGLDQAYDMACRAHPEVYAKIDAARRADAERERAKQQREKAAAAKQAGSSVVGTPAERGQPEPSGDIREDMRRLFAERGAL